MKKWFYVLFPVVLIVIFGIFYSASRKEAAEKERQHQEEVARLKADADAKKAAAEATARADAEKRAKDTAEKERAEAAAKEQKYNDEMAKIKEDTAKLTATEEMYAKKVSDLTIELDGLHKQRESLTRDTFELAKQIQMAEVARHNAEMEIQRYDTMIADAADQSQLSKMPPPPPEPAKS